MQPPATPELSLVMRLGQRFESARRLFSFGLSKRDTQDRENPRVLTGGFLIPPTGSLRRCLIRSHPHLVSLASRPDILRVGDSLKWGGSPRVRAEAATRSRSLLGFALRALVAPAGSRRSRRGTPTGGGRSGRGSAARSVWVQSIRVGNILIRVGRGARRGARTRA